MFPPAKLLCITFWHSQTRPRSTTTTWWILLLPFAFVFWISPANRCLQPEWPYFMSCELAQIHRCYPLSPSLSILLFLFLHPASVDPPSPPTPAPGAMGSFRFTLLSVQFSFTSQSLSPKQHGPRPCVRTSWPTHSTTMYIIVIIAAHVGIRCM